MAILDADRILIAGGNSGGGANPHTYIYVRASKKWHGYATFDNPTAWIAGCSRTR